VTAWVISFRLLVEKDPSISLTLKLRINHSSSGRPYLANPNTLPPKKEKKKREGNHSVIKLSMIQTLKI
jgi:hypothetical protein